MSQESVSLTLRTLNYYHREYANDVAAWQQAEPQANQPQEEETCTNICARVAVVALPFVALYKPASFFLSLGLNGIRSVSSITELSSSLVNGELQDVSYSHVLQVAVSVIALAGTVFAHPIGMLITTSHDLIIEVAQLVQHLQSSDLKKAAQSCLTIINNTLYLALWLQGGLELGIASLAVQILIGIYHSQDELSRGNYLEAAGHMGMAMVRGSQLYDQAQTLRLRWKIENLLSAAKSDPKKISFKSGPATTQNTTIRSAFPIQLPPGEWERERFSITYKQVEYEGGWVKEIRDATSTVSAAQDSSHIVYYFSLSAPYNREQVINAIGSMTNVTFNLLDVQYWTGQTWTRPTGQNWTNPAWRDGSLVQQWSGRSSHKSLGSGTWEALFFPGKVLFTTSFNGLDNNAFFEKVRALNPFWKQ